MESELFGHEAGAYTDARTATSGLLETAQGGTVLLDEVGMMPLQLQSKLLHLLEPHIFRRVGGDREISISARFVGATNEDLEQAVDAGRFRLDLFYRLNVLRIDLPPLRERVEDIVPIAQNTIQEVAERAGLPPPLLGSSAVALLNRYTWPGNVRELRNVIERAVVMTDRGVVRAEDLEIARLVPKLVKGTVGPLLVPSEDGSVIIDLPATGIDIEKVGKQFVCAAMRRTSGKVAPAARLLRLTRETLRYRITRHGIDPAEFGAN
jgi:DNA-binding NtrC family response regulator